MQRESKIQITCSWTSAGMVHLTAGGIEVPELPQQPGVYQWVFRHDGRERRYVGEAANLRNRFASYVEPAEDRRTDRRMNDRAMRVLGAGGEVEILLAEDVQVRAGGNPFDDLSHVHARRLVENAVLVELIAGQFEVINDRGYGDLRKDPVLG
jgi:hypothetical protein